MSPRRAAVATVLFTLAALALGGCRRADERQAIAGEFIDRLFVVIDQKAARELATGLAAQKIDEEIRLKDGQVIDAGTEKPSVTYRLLESQAGAEPATLSLVYELHVQPDGSEAFERRLILTLRKVDDTWRVANYTLEQPGGSGS